MNAQFWKIADEWEMRAAVIEMDKKFQAAMRSSLGIREPVRAKDKPKAKPQSVRLPRDVIDLRNVADILPIRTSPVSLPNWKAILYEVCQKHDVLMVDILSTRRDVKSVAARQEAMYRMRTETTMSSLQIGRRMGGRDHTTVLHGIRAHKARMEAAAQ